jgi:hypothetical protein
MHLTISDDLFRSRFSHVFARADSKLTFILNNFVLSHNNMQNTRQLFSDSGSSDWGCFIVRDPPVTFFSHMWQRKQNWLPKRPVLLMNRRPMKSKRRGICFGIWWTIFQVRYSLLTPELAAIYYFATVKYWRYVTLYIKAKSDVRVTVHRIYYVR